MHVVIIGATGLIGSALTQRMLSKSEVKQVTVIVRKKKIQTSKKMHQIVLSEFSVHSIEQLSVKADAYCCSLGTTIKKAKTKENFKEIDLDYVLAFARLAQREKAKVFFVVSSLGASKKSCFFYSRVKGQMEEALQTLSLNSLYILRPSILIGKRQEKRFSEYIAINIYRFLKKGLPKRVLQVLGSEVQDIIDLIERKIFCSKTGVHFISKF